MNNHEAIFHHTDIENLEKATTLKAPYYIPSSQRYLESADEKHIFTPEDRKDKKSKSKLEYQPINYSHTEESGNSLFTEKLNKKYSTSYIGDSKHLTEVSESEDSDTIGDLRDLSESLNEFDDSFASDTPLSKRIVKRHQRPAHCHESFNLSLDLETDSENSSSFEFSSLSSNNSDTSAHSSSDTSNFLSERKLRMPQRSTTSPITLLNRFRHGKPRPPTSVKERCRTTLGSSSNDRNYSDEEKLQTKEIGKKRTSQEVSFQPNALEERDLNRRMFDVEVDRLLQESAALSCGEVTSLSPSRVLPDPQGKNVVTEKSYDRDLHSHKNPASGGHGQNDDILYQWRLKRKLEKAHTRVDQKNKEAEMRSSMKPSKKCLCDDDSPVSTKQVAEKPYAHQQEKLKETSSNNCYHHNASACCGCYCSHDKHQLPPPLIESREEGTAIEVASTQTQTGDSLLLAKNKSTTTTKPSNTRKSIKKRQKESAVQTVDDIRNSNDDSSQPDNGVLADDGSSFVDSTTSSNSTNRLNHKGKSSTDAAATVPSLTPTSKMMKKVVGNRLFEQSLDESKSINLSSPRSLLTTSRDSHDQTNTFDSHENSPQISNRSKDCEALTLDVILKRVEDDDGDFDYDEVLATLRSKRSDLIEQLRSVENLLDKHYRS